MKPSNLFRLAALAALYLLFEPRAFAGEIELVSPRAEATAGTVQARATFVPTENVQFTVGDPDGKNAVRADTAATAVNLWILVDSSALCQTQKVDGYVNQIVHALKRQANPQTLVTLITYTSEASEFLVRRRAVEELEDVKVECEARPFSTSYGQPLLKLLQEDTSQELPVVAWVFTGGNIEIADKTAKAIAARNIELTLVLYNEFIEKEIQPTVQATAAVLKGRSFHFGLLPKADQGVLLPSMRYQLKFPISRKWQGKSALLQFTGWGTLAGAPAAFAKTPTMVNVPPGKEAFWYRVALVVGWLILAGSFLYCLYRIIAYYRPRYCRRCAKRLSHHAPVCFFCDGARNGVLWEK